jgi:hypothetical protein
VSWSDPDIFYRRGIEVYEDPDLIREIGWKPTDVGAFGCTSRAQARRLAKAILYAQEYESELCTYRASYDHMATDGAGPTGISPGDLILVCDQERGNAIAGGRIMAVAGSTVTLDRPADATGTGTIYIEHSNGDVEWVTCSYTDASADVTLTASPTSSVSAGDLFILVAGGYEAEPFRVIKISETGPNMLEVAAVRYDANKFSAIYGETAFTQGDIMRVPNGATIAAPSGLVATEGYIYGADSYMRTIEIHWVGVVDKLLDYYRVSYSKDNDNWVNLPPTGGTAIRIENARAGVYNIRVQAVNKLGKDSQAATTSYTMTAVPTPEALPLGTIAGLALQSGGTSFTGRDAALKWTVTSPTQGYLSDQGITTNTGFTDPSFRDCLITITDINPAITGVVTLRTESIVDTVYTYTYEKNFADNAGVARRSFWVSVQYRDIYGRVSDKVSVNISNPAPAYGTLPVLTPGSNSIGVQTTRPADPDFAGTKIYMSLTNGFTPGSTNLVYDGLDSTMVLLALGSGVHYLRVQPYDSFGAGTMTAQQSVTPATLALDTVAPATPTGLSLASVISTSPDGTQIVQLVATWTANGESDLAGYVLAIQEGAGNFVEFTTGSAIRRLSRRLLLRPQPRIARHLARLLASPSRLHSRACSFRGSTPRTQILIISRFTRSRPTSRRPPSLRSQTVPIPASSAV